jgi:hypothetical protein
MSTKFVCFINAHTRKPILVNPDHVRTVRQAVRLRSRRSWMTGKAVVIRTWRATLK